jgi:hypothetical protein
VPPPPGDAIRVLNGVLVAEVNVEVSGPDVGALAPLPPLAATPWVAIDSGVEASVRVSSAGGVSAEMPLPTSPGRHTLLVTATYTTPPDSATRVSALAAAWLSEDVPSGVVRLLNAMGHRSLELSGIASEPVSIGNGGIDDVRIDRSDPPRSFTLVAAEGPSPSRAVTFHVGELPVEGGPHLALLGSAFAHPAAPYAPVALTWTLGSAPRAFRAEPEIVLVALVDGSPLSICGGTPAVGAAIGGRAGSFDAVPLVAALGPWSIGFGACDGAGSSLPIERPSGPGRVVCAGSADTLACFEDTYLPRSAAGAPFLRYLNASRNAREVRFSTSTMPMPMRVAARGVTDPVPHVGAADAEVVFEDEATRYRLAASSLGDPEQIYLLGGGPRPVALFAPGGAAWQTRVLEP